MKLDYTHEELREIFAQADRSKLSFAQYDKAAIATNPCTASFLEKIRRQGDIWRKEPIYSLPFSYFKLFETTGDRFFFEDSEQGYFPHRGRLVVFAILSWLFGKEEDIAQLEDIIWAICDEYTWAVPAHLRGTGLKELQNGNYMIALFAAETASALAETIAMVGDKLAPIVVKRARKLIKERILDQYLVGSYGWETSRNNWAAVCAGSIGVAAMYELSDPDALATEMEKLLPAFRYFMGGFAEDGACLEGIGYWNYGFGYFVWFAEMLCRLTGGKMDLFDDEKVHKVAAFQQKCFLPGNRTVCFSDGSSKASYHVGLVNFLRTRFADIAYPSPNVDRAFFMHGVDEPTSGDHCYRFLTAVRQLLWAPQTMENPPASAAYPLPSAQWYIASSQNGVGLAAKAGNNAEPHNHNDVGSFHIYKNGETMLTDFGSGEYTQDYFGAARYTYNVCGSQGHNLPLVNGHTQQAGLEFAAKDVTVDETGIVMDIAPAYALPTLAALKREIRFDRATGETKLTDSFRFTQQPESIVERFVTPYTVQINRGFVVLASDKTQTKIYYDPAKFSVKITPADFVAHFGYHTVQFFVDFTAIAPTENETYDFTIL